MRQRIKAFLLRAASVLGVMVAVLVVLTELMLAVVSYL